MKFTRLRLVGFKSFVDPCEVLIEPGLTGIVGPNGCGKSNLVEGLRWVMGESSHKSLRAAGMDEVIFAGNGGRPARSSAEVALVVDNTERTAPAQFNDADTLEVVRRIEREAGSVYKINGRDVRARDVQLLFADASTGAHSPALVRQGQIGEVIAAKPRDRRRILEEAAGISGLHSRRHEAELRLRAAEQNIERLDDVIAQLAAQLDGLKRQARQATRYRALSAEIRKTEALLWHLRREAALEAVRERAGVAEAAQAKVAEASGAAGRAATVRAEAAAALPALRDAEAETAARLRHLTVSRDAIDKERARIEARRHELTERLSQTKSDLERERSTVASTDETLARLDAEHAEIAEETARAEGAAEDLERRVSETADALGKAETALAEATAANADAAARRREHERAMADESARLERLERERTDVDAEIARLRQDDAAAEIAESAAALASAEEAATAAEAEATQADEAQARARAAQEAARGPLNEAERDLKALETEKATLEKVLAVDDDALWPPLIDRVTVAAGFEAALGAAFGDDLDHPADEGAPIHWRDSGAGSDDPPLPEAAKPLADVVTAPAVLVRRLRQTGLVARDRGAALQGALRPGQRLVSVEGDLWRWDGYTAAADAPTAAARRLAQRNRLDEVAREARDAVARRDELRRAAAEADEAVQAAGQAAAAAREAWKAAQATLSRARDAHAEAERNAGRIAARLTALNETRARIVTDAGEAEHARARAQAELEELPAVGDAEAGMARLKAEAAAARQDATEARSARDGHLREAELRANRHARLDAERLRWSERTRDAEQQIATLERRVEDLGSEIAALDEEPAKLDGERARLTREIEEMEARRKAAADALAAGETALADADRAAREADTALASARETQAREEATLDGLRQRLADLEATIEDALERPVSEALAASGWDAGSPLPTAAKLEADLERLKRDRERLGSVNLRAEEEMREIEERHGALAAERRDLEAAIHRLRGAIQSLNREGRERLTRAFDVVDGHFRDLFARLFGGGAAELKLTESDDPLEAGLEIVAQPPGKRPSTLTLLSGGEQALTAMALIFAVFLTNPAPICVLDEVDAPLDDANVERFCDLMDEMARTTDTRFLLITHNPITMSRVDRLFGVTMAERGVSQLVSVDIGGALRLREAG